MNYCKKLLNLITILLISITFFSCKEKKQGNINQVNHLSENVLEIKYATGFSISYHNTYKEVIVYSPWEKGIVYARYYLTDSKDTQIPDDGVRVVAPLQTIGLTSVTQIEFIDLIGEINSVTGICSPALVYNEKIREKTNKGEIADLGDAFNMNVERTLVLNPGALMTSGYNQNDPNAQRVSKAGIPVLYNNEWMETSLLARAEWIKFVSVFYNKESIADSIFAEIEDKYLTICEKAGNVADKPSILSGSNFRGTWYVPGGNSFMGKLFADAGADYFYKNDTTSGSLPLNIETILVNFSDADVWLNCSYNNMEELYNADKKNALFRSVKENKVYNFNKRLLNSGANDFWESAVAHPDILLADVIAVLHPGILPEHELFYTKKLE